MRARVFGAAFLLLSSCTDTPRCESDSDCASGEACVSNDCMPLCVDSRQCPDGQVCRVGACVEGGSLPSAVLPPRTTTDEDVSVMMVLTGSDTDGAEAELTVEILSGPAHGVLNARRGAAPLSVLYTPAVDYHGSDELSFTVTDRDGFTTEAARASIEVQPVNDAPVAVHMTVELGTDGRAPGILQAIDVDGDALHYELVGAPVNGAVTLAATTGVFDYQAAADFDCDGRFEFVASDGELSSDATAVTVERPASIIESLSPERGTTGMPLVIQGQDFCSGVGRVTVGGRSPRVISWSNRTVVVEVPRDFTSGLHEVVVTTARDRPGSAALYHVVPWIAKVDPRVVLPSDSLRILGDAFGTTAGTVYVGGLRASASSWTNTEVEISVPGSMGAGRQMVEITTHASESSNVYPVTRPGSGLWITEPLPEKRAWHSMVWSGTEIIVWGGSTGDGVTYGTGGRYNPVTDTWVSMSTTNAPTPRSGHTAVWTGTEMIVWGGGGGGYLDTGGRYDPTTDTWVSMSTMNAPTPRNGHTAVWTGTELIVWGGYDGSVYFDTGVRYNPVTDTWTATSATNAPTPRDSHTAVWTGSEMIIWGGSNRGVYLDTGARYNPVTDTWTATSATNAPTPRSRHTAVWTGSEMIVWGGYFSATGGGANAYNTGAKYSPITDSWATTSTVNAPTARDSHTAVWSGLEMIVWGGDSSYNTGGRYNPITDTWLTTKFADAPRARDYSTAVWTGSEMVVWGGLVFLGMDPETGVISESATSTGGRYDPSTNTWVRVATASSSGAPMLHSSTHSVAWTGREMVVWGGAAGERNVNTGARYMPAIDAWTSTSTTNAPTPRSSHTAVWTGTEMIIWGGSASSVRVNTGGRYRPDADTWVSTSTTNAPSVRVSHTAVWTGTEMIIWGGASSAGAVNTGGRYRPGTDTWVSTSTTNAPSARSGHTAVWTGTEMVVWGGGEINTGGRYDPDNDTWRATATTNAPVDKSGDVSVWTGSEMIVWGGMMTVHTPGNTYNTYFSSGSRYSPSADTWTSMNTVNAPSARAGQAAVWTGTHMIVWGGRDDNGYFSTGGLYNPATNTWTPAVTTGAPSGRTSPDAVWSGSEMVIWGGYDGADIVDTMARYSP